MHPLIRLSKESGSPATEVTRRSRSRRVISCCRGDGAWVECAFALGVGSARREGVTACKKGSHPLVLVETSRQTCSGQTVRLQ